MAKPKPKPEPRWLKRFRKGVRLMNLDGDRTLVEVFTGLNLQNTEVIPRNHPDFTLDNQVGDTFKYWTWRKPEGALWVQVTCIGGGGGGGAGRRGAAGTNRGSGSGGGGAAWNFHSFAASQLPDIVNVTSGIGGAGGVAPTTNDTNGGFGSRGGFSAFGRFVRALGGEGGAGGVNFSSPYEAVNDAPMTYSMIPGHLPQGWNGRSDALGCPAGGTGGLIDLGNSTDYAPTPGGVSLLTTALAYEAGYEFVPGRDGLDAESVGSAGRGGSGGSSAPGAVRNGGRGGNAGAGGGGGAGGTNNATNTGAGGKGGDGVVVVATFF